MKPRVCLQNDSNLKPPASVVWRAPRLLLTLTFDIWHFFINKRRNLSILCKKKFILLWTISHTSHPIKNKPRPNSIYLFQFKYSTSPSISTHLTLFYFIVPISTHLTLFSYISPYINKSHTISIQPILFWYISPYFNTAHPFSIHLILFKYISPYFNPSYPI